MFSRSGNRLRSVVSNASSSSCDPNGTGKQRRNSMFNNLIESTSHAQEFKRRGSFLLFTTATYLVLFVIAGVASIYAYDAHLDSQRTELEITFIPIGPPQPEPARSPTRPSPNPETASPHPIRTELIESTSNPTNIPD